MKTNYNFFTQTLHNNLICMYVCRFYYTELKRRGDHGGLKEFPKVGDFCCARYSQDSKWYRARVLSVDAVNKSNKGKRNMHNVL